MGLLVDGVWQQDGVRTQDGHFVRPAPRFRNWVTPDGSPGPSGEGDFAAEAGRYHLYVSLACPWAHRTIILRKLKGLEETIGMTVADPLRDELRMLDIIGQAVDHAGQDVQTLAIDHFGGRGLPKHADFGDAPAGEADVTHALTVLIDHGAGF